MSEKLGLNLENVNLYSVNNKNSQVESENEDREDISIFDSVGFDNENAIDRNDTGVETLPYILSEVDQDESPVDTGDFVFGEDDLDPNESPVETLPNILYEDNPDEAQIIGSLPNGAELSEDEEEKLRSILEEVSGANETDETDLAEKLLSLLDELPEDTRGNLLSLLNDLPEDGREKLLSLLDEISGVKEADDTDSEAKETDDTDSAEKIISQFELPEDIRENLLSLLNELPEDQGEKLLSILDELVGSKDTDADGTTLNKLFSPSDSDSDHTNLFNNSKGTPVSWDPEGNPILYEV